MTQTEHYQLNQWGPDDKVHHDDFNEDNRKIDAALKALDAKEVKLPKFKRGWYRGTGEESMTIHLGYYPDAVLVFSCEQFKGSSKSVYGGLTTTGCTVELTVGGKTYEAIQACDEGFIVHETDTGDPNAAVHCNIKGAAYAYFAFKD